MGLFGLFGRKKLQSDVYAWAEVAGKLAGTLWEVIHIEPKIVANPYARVVLDDRWNVGIACDYREPDGILGHREVAFVFLQEDPSGLRSWVDALASGPNPLLQQMATEEYAKQLVRVLMSRVNVVD